MMRPGIRRKSSASNLLASFKPGSSSGPSTSSGVTTPTPKEWDSQSVYSETSAVPTMSSTATAPPLPSGAGVDQLRELMVKRMQTIRFLRGIHTGRSFCWNTVLLTRMDLDRAFTPSLKKQRTYRYAILGMSLSNVFEFNQPADFLRMVLGILGEWDSVPEDTMKPKMRNIFRGSKLPKKSGGGDHSDADASYLVSPNIPFTLDYFQVCFALFDILTDVYKRFAEILGPGRFSPSSAVGPGQGITSSVPLSSTASQASSSSIHLQSPTAESDRSNYFTNGHDRVSPLPSFGVSGIMPGLGGVSGPPSVMTATSSTVNPTSPPATHSHWNPAWGESINKADQKFMRIITSILKKIDEIARNRIREELQSLTPLLQNLSSGPVGYDYDDR